MTTTATPPYRGVYINLDRNTHRRGRIEENFAAAGVAGRYTRCPAVDGKAVAGAHDTPLDPGSLGLWLTHEKIAREFAGTDRHLHVLEDDAVLPRTAAALLDGALQHADAHLPGWDLLFTDTYIAFEMFRVYESPMKAHEREGRFAYLDLAPLYLAGMTSFFINRRSVARYGEAIRDQWRAGAPVDMHVRRLIRDRRLRAYVTVPFMTSLSQAGNQSDIRGDLDVSHRVSDTFRRGFFVEADRRALLNEMRALTAGVVIGPLQGLYLGGLTHYLSDRWKPF